MYKIRSIKIFMLILSAGLIFAPAALAEKNMCELAGALKGEPKGLNALNWAEQISQKAPCNQEEISLLLEVIQKTENPVREKVISSIAKINDPELAKLFIKELKNPNPMVQGVACGLCGKFKFIEAEKDIIEIIKKSPPILEFPDDDQERTLVTAVLALGELKQESSLDTLLPLVGTLKGYEIQALRKFGAKPLPALFKKMNESPGSNAQMALIQIIMAIEDKEAIPVLEQESAKKESKARPYAVTVLLKMDQEKYLPLFIGEWEKEHDVTIESRLLYFVNNWRLGDGRNLDFLISVLKNSPQAVSRQLAISSLSRIKDERAKGAIKEAVNDPDKKVQLYASQALEMMETPEKEKSDK